MSEITQYYMNQASGMPYFSGPVSQQGHGFGGIFGRLFRAAVPLLKKAAPVVKSAAKTVAKEAIRSGADVVDDLLSGENLGDSLAHRSEEGAKRIAKIGVKKVKKMMASPKKPINRKKIRPTRDIFG